MLYVVKRVNDSHYLSSFENAHKRIEFEFTPIATDALKLPLKGAEAYICAIHDVETNKANKYEIVSV